MKAYFLHRYGNADQAFELREVADPIPDKDHVVIDVESFGLNFADVMARRGMYNAAPPLPFIPGYEVCGKVVAVGDDAHSHWIGKRVATFTRFGGYAQKALAPIQALIPVEASIPADIACALCTQYATAWYAVHECVPVRKGERAFVYAGAGGVGTALIQLLKNKGLHVTVQVSNEEKKQYALQQGADAIVISADAKRLQSKLQQVTFDLIFNPVYGKTLKPDLKRLNSGGRLVLFGASSRLQSGKGKLSTLWYGIRSGFVFPVLLMMKTQSISGINMLDVGDQHPELLRKCMESVFKAYVDKSVEPHTHVFSDEELPQAHALLESRKSLGKLVIRW